MALCITCARRTSRRTRVLLAAALVVSSSALALVVFRALQPVSMCDQSFVQLRPDRVEGAAPSSPVTRAVEPSIASAVRSIGAGEMVTFVAANLAYAEMALNFFRIAARLRPPLTAAFSVAIDSAARDRLSGAMPPLFSTVFEASARAHEGNASVFGHAAYNALTERKWEVAAAVLATGRHALMVDPDVALLRNPASYLEAAPQCDFATMMELSDGDASAANLRAVGGYAFDDFANWMNTGFVLFRAAPRTSPFINAFLDYLALPSTRAINRDDQHHFNTFFHSRLRPRGLLHTATLVERGQHLIDTLVAGRCLEFIDADAADGAAVETRISWLPLPPPLFMNRLALDKFALHERALEKPFAVHHNWLLGVSEKVCSLRVHGQWEEESTSDDVS